ncbi:hypothetical protein AMJ39_03160 [candidate division TA06 bacterium DG_24]|uniref:Uncharacterized protein n=2 Tax=Bacteria division TA06 TaxID=1156500 RepID=A0A0S8JIS8_UNCT6|nr:MAG: hypothetical protein AMJ39_03160 [candidate division TA06 bacterium DG_24]KPL09498.1 MAG: hypothetical protein AMJ71_06190 [candidate division TA06 bacterium SM1_40]
MKEIRSPPHKLTIKGPSWRTGYAEVVDGLEDIRLARPIFADEQVPLCVEGEVKLLKIPEVPRKE